MAVVHTGGRDRRATRSSRATSGCCSPPSTRRMGRKLDSATVEQDQRVQQHAGIAPAGRPAQRSRRHGARLQRAHRRSTRCATSRTGSAACTAAARRSCSSAKGIDYDINDMIRANGSNHQSASIDHRRDARRDWRGDAARTSRIYGIDPRGLTDLGDEVDRASARSRTTPRSASAPSSLQQRAAAVAGQPAHAVGGDRRLRRRQPQRFHDRLRAHRRGQQLVLRAGVLPAGSASATASSTRSTSA